MSNESNTNPSVDHRRSFLKLAGFGMFAACSRGLEYKAIPLLNPIEERVPGKSVWYSSLCGGCSAACGMRVRSRDGRPVKLEGNPEHPISRGGLCAAGQAGVLSLYDSHRLSHPLVDGAQADWGQVDTALRGRIGKNGSVRFLTGTVHSPSALAAIQRFGSRHSEFAHVQYDALSSSAMLDVHEKMLGRRAMPRLRFDRAEVIVSFDADFLGTWISPVEFTRDYGAGRSLDGGEHSYHAHFEGRMSLTGGNADRRFVRDPAGLAESIAELAVALARRIGTVLPFTAKTSTDIEDLAARLAGVPRGRTLIVCGIDDIDAQRLVAWMNEQLGNYGSTLDTGRLSRQRQGNAAALANLRKELAAGSVGTLLVAGCNPAYDLVGGLDTTKVKTVVSFAERVDETAAQAHFVCPDHHALEAWGDAEAIDGIVTIGQPTIQPLNDTRALIESLARWSGDNRSAYDLVRETWKRGLQPRTGDVASFDLFWSQSVHDGFAALPTTTARVRRPRIDELHAPVAPTGESGQLALVLYPKTGILDGRHAHNPWLQEMPDPITKIVWDNYACLSTATAASMELESGDLVSVGGLTLPVHIQQGQHDGVVAIPLGYGRKGTDRFANIGPEWLEGTPTLAEGELVGVNAAPLADRTHVHVKRANGHRDLAATQRYDSLTVPEHLGGTTRPMVQAMTLTEWRDDSHEGEHAHHAVGELWPADHTFKGHHWGMAIDLSACTGCSACVVGCQAENNIPVVGKDEVLRSREMHWMRIDRYYDDDAVDTTISNQPMLCQHCDNAPCETVCPVLATVQSSEGLNQQIYNRCVGTRYCANNCPYKTRRFNWFDYPHEDKLQNMSLNPDVVVRSRGIMEKCSFCIQRISEAKSEARAEDREVRDGEIQPACMQSCPAGAILFGDLNDPKSKVATAWRSRRHYRVLEEVNTKPGVGYGALVRNRDV